MEEEWRPVIGFEGRYEVSNLGRVRGLDRMIPDTRRPGHYRKWKGKIIAPDVLKDGYYKIGLHKDGKKHLLALHRVVAMAFVDGQTEDKRIINHIDNNPANNRADNLEWCTYAYNNTYNECKQRAWVTRMKRGKGYINPPKAVEAWKDGKLVERFPSLRTAADKYKCTPTLILYACKGKVKQAVGLQWKYASDNPETGEKVGLEYTEIIKAVQG